MAKATNKDRKAKVFFLLFILFLLNQFYFADKIPYRGEFSIGTAPRTGYPRTGGNILILPQNKENYSLEPVSMMEPMMVFWKIPNSTSTGMSASTEAVMTSAELKSALLCVYVSN